MGKLQLKRSNVIENGKAKEPTPPLMEYGELAVNYNADDPVIFIKNHLGEIIRLVAPGQDGAKGEKGAAGKQGTEGKEGQKGDKGASGPKGQKGQHGTPGNAGAQGFKGNKGIKGEDGNKGRRGEKGNQGAKGKAGDKGERGLKGDKGAKGAKGAVTVVGDIIEILPVPGPPTTPCLTDQNVIIDSDGVAWICLNGSWESIGTIVGPPGQTGDKGAKGAKGNKGTKGETGADGIGEKGEKGDLGTKGNKGDGGEKGDKGNKGVKGNKGDKGVKGVIGPKGIKGVGGTEGAEGPKGPKGAKGQKGVEGPRGFGEKGVNGEKGDKGFKGAKGEEGPKGQKGAKGTDGVIGSIDGTHKGSGPPPGSNCTTEGEIIVDEDGVAWRCDGAGNWVSLGEITGAPGVAGTKGSKGEKGIQGFPGNDGSKGEVGEGEPGQKGELGGVGPDGEKGNKGNLGKGAKGDDGVKGDKGNRGVFGRPGTKGEVGPKGEKGARSNVEGPKGEKGQEGPGGGTGGTGQKGEKGELGVKGDPGTESAGSFWGHVEYVKGGDEDQFRDSYIYKDTIDDPGKNIRRVYFYNNQLRIELATFSVTFSVAGQTNLWDVPATAFTVTVNNPDDYLTEYVESIAQILEPVGMHPIIADYTSTPPSPTPGPGVDWTQIYQTNAVAKIVSNGTGLSGGSASGKLQMIEDDGEVFKEAPTVSFGWSNVGSTLNTANCTGATFLETYTGTTYTISVGGLSDMSHVSHAVSVNGGSTSNPSGPGNVTFDVPLHKDNAGGRSVELVSTFSRPAEVTGTAYTANDTDTDSVNADFTYPSWVFITIDRNTPPVPSEIISGTTYASGVIVRGDQSRRINETVTNDQPIPRALWFAVRSAAQQPTQFKIGENANLIFDVEYTTSEIELQPDSPPAGYTPEKFTLYGLTLQPGNTYVSIN
jgi:hypothetical protein